MSDPSAIAIKKPEGKLPHDVLDGADKASMLPNGRPRMQAIFEVVSQQIALDLERAKAAGSKEEAIAIFQASYDAYQRDRGAVIDKLDRLVAQ